MQSVVGALRVNLGLDSAQFSRGMSQAQKDLASARKAFMAASAVGVAAFAAISAAALRGASGIDAAAKAARRVDSSIGGFRAMEMAAGEAGVAVSTLADAVQTMDREVAKGSKTAQESLERLGLTAKDLEGLEADQKMALLADRIQELGLSTGDTSAVLQGLGIRNKEMVLALGAGGDAFRNARRDVEEYGLSISKVDADAIEKANDAIGRLGLISQYAREQLAIQLVPAMGRMAEAMTDSLREGGLLRAVIDGLTSNIDVLGAAVGAVVVVMGTRYVAALAVAKGATLSFAGALAVARGAVTALLGPIGLIYTAIGLAAAAFVAYRNDSDRTVTAMDQTATASRELGIELGLLANDRGLPAVSRATIALANDNLKLADSAFITARAQMELAKATAQAAFTQKSLEAAYLPGVEPPSTDAYDAAMRSLAESAAAVNEVEAELKRRIEEGNGVRIEATEIVSRLGDQMSDLENEINGRGGAGGAKSAIEGMDEATKAAADQLRKAAEAAEAASEAFRGFARDGIGRAVDEMVGGFKGGMASIWRIFTDTIRQMIAHAAKNRIMISLGIGGSGVGTAASAGTGMLGALGTFGSSIGTGLSVVGSGFAAGGFSGAATAMGGAISGGLSMGGAAGLGTALGAAIPVIGAVALAFAALRKTTTVLDSGIKVAVEGMSATVTNFTKTQTSRFFGLSTSTGTRSSVDPNSPIGAAINEMQSAAMQAARVLGTGAVAFENFSHDFRLSLKGLSEDQRQAKIQEELGRLGDSFATLVPNVKNLNELLERAAQISASIRALTDRQGLFVTQADAVFAASQAGNQRPTSTIDDLVDSMHAVLRAIREGDINQARLLSQSVALQQRTVLGPTA